MDSILTMGTASYAHTYGNIVEAIKMDILSKYPPDYFKYIHVSSQLAFREMKRFKDNSLVEFRKQERPKIYIKPTFEVSDDSIPFFGTLLTNHMYCGTGYISKGSLMPIFKDSYKHIELDFRMNRDKVIFDINIQVETLMRQLDLYKNMQNMIAWDAPHMKRFSLESMIPRPMIQYIAKNANINLDNTPGSIATIVSYLQMHGSFPITYKIRNSSSLDEFFMYYEVPALLNYSDLQVDDGNKKGMTDDSYGINFRVTCEFNHPGAYVIRSVEGYPDIVPTEIRIDTGDEKELIPLYTLDRLYEDHGEVMDGFKLYFVTSVQTEYKFNGKKDSVNLKDIIEPQYYQVLKKYVFSHIPSDVLMRVQLFKNNEKLTYGDDYYVDWNTMNLYIEKSDSSVTYRIILYANMTKFQEEFQTMMELTKRDKTYANIENPIEVNDVWRDRENNLFRESSGDYFMPKRDEQMNHDQFTDDRKEIL